jgi:putative membrane protein
MTKILLTGLLVALLTTSGCGRKSNDSATPGGPESPQTDAAPADQSGAASAESATPPTQDQTFFEQAAEGGMAEVEAGQLAQEKGSSKSVKDFAAMMVKDHTEANDKLKTIAASHSVTLPTALSAQHQEMKTRLSGLSGKDFDKEYMRGQVQDHETTVSLLRTESESGQNADAKAFASETLPTVEAHLKKAQDIASKLGVQ